MVRTADAARRWPGARRVPGSQTRVDRQTELAVKDTGAADVVAVFVREHQRMAVANVVTIFRQTRLGFGSADAGVKQQTRIAAADEHTVTRTA